jgi:rod shape determining protein RodA
MGWLNIYAAVYDQEHARITDFSQRYGKQMIWIIFALVLAITTLLIEGQFYAVFANFFYGAAIFLLLLVLVLGKEINGAKSWFVLGPIRFQPAEFAKIATILAVSKFLSSYNFKLRTTKNLLLSLGLIFFPPLLIILQPDGGSAMVFVALMFMLYREGLPDWAMLLGIYFVLLFIFPLTFGQLFTIIFAYIIASVTYWFVSRRFDHFTILAIPFSLFYLAIRFLENRIPIPSTDILLVSFSAVISLVLGVLAVRKRIKNVLVILLFFWVSIGFIYSFDFVFDNFLSDYQQRRINIVLGLEDDPQGYGYNVDQSKKAIGSGGFAGKGFLQGTLTKLRFVPEQSTDFIFCTVGEEWGYVGTTVVILLFLFFFLRLLLIAERQRLKFSRIYAYGVVSIFFFHFLINIGMTIGLMPVIGIPLPFFSYGGSSLWAFTIMLFILLKLDVERLQYLR